MLRTLVASALFVLVFGTSGWAQAPSSASNPANPAPAKPIAKKTAPKTKSGAKQPPVVETGPCRLGVISTLGDLFSVQKFGLTIFETEVEEVPVNGWGLDDLAIARVRAATGADPSVRRIAYPKGAFDLFYNPKSRILLEPNERLEPIVQSITQNAGCERYLVITKFNAEVAGTKKVIKGIGAYNQGLGSAFRNSHLFANVAVNLIDGRTYERINRAFALFSVGGAPAAEFELTKLDNSLFPDPPGSAAANATLRDRTRALITATLDRVIPVYLKD
jgi:hypothetical protein